MRRLLSSPTLHACLTFIFFFSLYAYTAPRTNVSYADSDLLTVMGYQLGLAHPPGYPLYIAVVYFFTHLPIPGTIAFRAHLSSAWLHALTLAVLFLASHKIAKFSLGSEFTTTPKPLNKWVALLIAWVSTAGLGFSFLFWLYSSVVEKYALNDLFAALVLYLTLTIQTSTPPKPARWLALAIVTALALGHHHSFLMFAPYLLLFAIYHRHPFISSLKFTLPAFILTLSISLGLILWLNSLNSPVSWHFAPSFNQFVNFITRRDLSGYLITSGKPRAMYLNSVTLTDLATKIPAYLNLLLDHFVFLPVILAAVGLILLVCRRTRLTNLLFAATLFTTIFIPLYVEWPPDLSTQALRIRMHLLGLVPLPLLIALALSWLTNLADRHLKRFSAFIFCLPLAILLILVSVELPTNFKRVDLHTYDATSSHYRTILEAVPQNTLLACISDVSCFALLYAQQIDNLRPDVLVLPHAYRLISPSLAANPNLKGFDYSDTSDLFIDYLTWNLGKRPVYLVELQQAYYDLLGLDYGFLYYIPHGYYGELTKDLPEILPTNDYAFSRELINTAYPPVDQMRQQLKASLAQKHLLNARFYHKYQRNLTAIDRELELATGLARDLPAIYQHQILELRALLATGETVKPYAPGETNPSRAQILTQTQTYVASNRFDLAYLGLTGLLHRDPTDPTARLALARLYELTGQLDRASLEYHHVLKYHPDNRLAIEKLELLGGP